MIKPIEELTIMNDYLFSVVMQQEKYCKPLLEYILQIKIRKINYLSEQETIISSVPDAKSIRLDVYVEDDQNTVYDIEVQTTDKRNLGKRMRYYQSMIDIRALEKGQDYRKLKKSIIIFICNFDPFEKSRLMYTFKTLCTEEPETVLKDEATKIVINTKGSIGDISKDLSAVIRYMDSGETSTDYTKDLDAEVQSVKADEKVRKQYMLLMEAYARERNMGKYEVIVSQIRNAIDEFTTQQMSKYFRVQEKDCAAVIEYIQTHPDWNDEQIAEQIDWNN